MPAVTSSALSPYEAVGHSISSPSIQMESKGTVAGSTQSLHEALHGIRPIKVVNQESTASVVGVVITSVYERLLTVKAVF
jgi:hypothetical protein